MKFLITISVLVAVVSAQQYAVPPKTLRELNTVHKQDGIYNFAFETENGIAAEEQGYLKNPGSAEESQVALGQYQYTSPEGQLIRLVYSASDEGFLPQGDHLPLTPPIPPLILKSLEYQAKLKRN